MENIVAKSFKELEFPIVLSLLRMENREWNFNTYMELLWLTRLQNAFIFQLINVSQSQMPYSFIRMVHSDARVGEFSDYGMLSTFSSYFFQLSIFNYLLLGMIAC